MNSVGSLSVAVRYVDGQLAGLDVRLERPPVAQLFIGQTPQMVASTVPYLYTLCARAQGTAAAAALAAAQEKTPPAPDHNALWIEALHEHFWRLLLDWPLALGLPQGKDAFVAWRAARSGGAISRASRALLEDALLGCSLEAWQTGGPPAATALAVRCLERLGAAGPLPGAEEPDFAPKDWLDYWRGEADEAPPPTRAASVAAAWQGRLAEAVAAALALESGRPYPVTAAGGEGWGIGQTRTARGILTHGVELDVGRKETRVRAYQVWAPTDRHFADSAELSALLAEGPWSGAEAAQRAVEQAVLALDPCLPYTVRVENA